jgi:hypothetical protein
MRCGMPAADGSGSKNKSRNEIFEASFISRCFPNYFFGDAARSIPLLFASGARRPAVCLSASGRQRPPG